MNWKRLFFIPSKEQKSTMENLWNYFTKTTILTTVAIFLSLTSHICCLETSAERRLLDNLTRDYDVALRPVVSHTDTVVIITELFIVSLSELNSVDQTINLKTYFKFTWTDPALSWDPAHYSDIDVTQPLFDRIWTPSVILIESLATHPATIIDWDNVYPIRVHSPGEVHWLLPATLHTSCSMDMTHFPSDQHQCRFFIAINGYSEKEVKFKIKPDMADAFNKTLKDGQWDFKNYSIFESHFDLLGENKSGIVIIITLKRRPDYFVIHLVYPVTTLSFLNVLVFLLPGSSGEKVSYSITVLLSVMLYQSSATSYLPQNSDTTPHVVVFLSCLTGLCILSVIAALATVCLQQRGITPSVGLVALSGSEGGNRGDSRDRAQGGNLRDSAASTVGQHGESNGSKNRQVNVNLDKYFLMFFLGAWITITMLYLFVMY